MLRSFHAVMISLLVIIKTFMGGSRGHTAQPPRRPLRGREGAPPPRTPPSSAPRPLTKTKILPTPLAGPTYLHKTTHGPQYSQQCINQWTSDTFQSRTTLVYSTGIQSPPENTFTQRGPNEIARRGHGMIWPKPTASTQLLLCSRNRNSIHIIRLAQPAAGARYRSVVHCTRRRHVMPASQLMTKLKVVR